MLFMGTLRGALSTFPYMAITLLLFSSRVSAAVEFNSATLAFEFEGKTLSHTESDTSTLYMSEYGWWAKRFYIVKSVSLSSVPG